MVKQNAYDITNDEDYHTIHAVEAISTSGASTGESSTDPDASSVVGPGMISPSGDTDDEDEEEDSPSSGSGSSSTSGPRKQYYINCNEAFFFNAGRFMVWDEGMNSFIPIYMDKVSFDEGDLGTWVNGWLIKRVQVGHGSEKQWYLDIKWPYESDPNPLYGYFELPKGAITAENQENYDDPLEFVARYMKIFTCDRCGGTHEGGTLPLSSHQVHIAFRGTPPKPNSYPCISIGTSTGSVQEGDLHFCMYSHEEDWKSDYNVKLQKFDYETGKPLQGAKFELYERFDDKDELNTERDGAEELYDPTHSDDSSEWQGGYKDLVVQWDDFRKAITGETDNNGIIEADISKEYHYEKTFCDGHPAPKFVEVPELEEAEEGDGGEGGDSGDSDEAEDNSEEVEEAKALNRQLAQQWLYYYDYCIDKAYEREGVHFHWVSDEVDIDTIREIAETGGEEGTTPYAGPSPDDTKKCLYKDEAYDKSGCHEDAQNTYEKFIALKYSYTWKEITARNGYIRHDLHTDDVPIEVITTDSSQNGANSHFANIYSKDITINEDANEFYNRDYLDDEDDYDDDYEDEDDDYDDLPGSTVNNSRTLLDYIIDTVADFFGINNVYAYEFDTDENLLNKAWNVFNGYIQSVESFIVENADYDENEEENEDEDDDEDEDYEEEEEISTASTIKKVKVATSSEIKTNSLFLDEMKISKNSSVNLTSRLFSLSFDEDEDEDEGSGVSGVTVKEDGDARFEEAFSKREGTDISDYSGEKETTADYDEEDRPNGDLSHCNNKDGEGDFWRIYDHRTPGEIHFNKRDLDLSDNTSDTFDDYAQTNGDGTLSGAVYGLFARNDIVHPDGKTGTIYQQNDLVAVATTDRDGNGSFMAYTEAPGTRYDYSKGTTVTTDWNNKAPKNLYSEETLKSQEHTVVTNGGYTDTQFYADDYTVDGNYKNGAPTKRLYDDNLSNNGNYWIGQPLIMGDYYIKELSRSEGYELSVNGKGQFITNDKSDFEPQFKQYSGSVSVSENVYVHPQETHGLSNELLYAITSENTADTNGYDVVLKNLPSDAKIYREDVSTEPQTVSIIDHYDYVDKKDENGNIIYKVAQTDGTIPKLKTDGSGKYETQETTFKVVANNIPFATLRKYDSRTISDMITLPDDPDGLDIPNRMAAAYTMNDEQTTLLKYKLEEILRTQGVKTPYVAENGKKKYSKINAPVYMRGVRAGETDTYNISGVGAGNTATETVYGPQIINVKLKKKNIDGNSATVADLIGSLMNYYQDHPYWNIGGIDHVESNDTYYDFYIYASNSADQTFITDKNNPVIYVPVKFNPDDTTKKPQYIYAKYVSEDADDNDKASAFGLYTNYIVNSNNTAKATLSSKVEVNSDNVLTGDGTMTPAKMIQPVTYKKGETIHDENGNPVPEKESVPVYVSSEINSYSRVWVPLNVTPNAKGEFVYHVTLPYTDEFGGNINDNEKCTISFKAVVPEGDHILTAADVNNAPKSYNAQIGQSVKSGEYYIKYKGAKAYAYLDYSTFDDGGDTYVKVVSLTYRDQEDTFQDGTGMPGEGTIKYPVQVYERPIRQKVRVIKDITTIQTKQVWYCNNCGAENTDSDTQCKKCHETRTTETTKTVKYDNDTYTAVHEDNLSASNDGTKTKDWGLQLLNDNISEEKADNIPDFMFKAYLKSNLERLYRDENGNVVWLDRNGNRMTPQYQDTNNDGNYDTFIWKYDTAFNNKTVEFPVRDYVHNNVLESANVQKIFTNIPHNTGSKTNSTIANNVLSKYQDPNTGNTENAGERNAFSTILRSKNDTVADPSDITGLGIYSNASLFSYKGWLDLPNKAHKAINADQNKKYTRILETTEETIPDGSTNGTTVINSYNYEKFFDAINVANVDKWDNDMYSTFTGNSMNNNPGQHWFDTFYEKYQKDDRDKDHTLANTDNSDKDNTTGGDKDTSFKPFRWIRENVFGNRADYEKYPAQTNGANTEVVTSTSNYARANAAASDAVRQFAIKWYLEDEIAKLEKDSKNYELIANKNNSTISYDEAIYDEGLYNAIAKTYNYMKPFYTYDLDTIYSVEWDSAENGGKDQDYTTLAVNVQDESSYYAISAYLPYGTYVIVEQQPNRIDSNVNEWKNKHYEIDKPKEIAIPTLYNSEQSNKEGITNYDSHYNFDASATLETLAKSNNYLIRFGDEWKNTGLKQNKYVIRAHNYFGDYELYPYGLTIDKVNSSERNYNGIDSDSGKFNYAGWRYVQEEYDPIKDVYNTQHRGENGADGTTKEEGANDGAGYYGTDITDGKPTANGDYYNGDKIKNDLFYGNISENKGVSEKEVYNLASYIKDNNTIGKYIKKNVRTVTGEQTAYDGKYSSILVPWSVTTPVNINNYNSKDFTGYADVRFTNKFKTTVLRINKTDSETGEYILHDNAIFGLYAASRYNTFDEIKKDSQLIKDSAEREQFLEQFKPGDAKFYLVDTTIYGSREFLEAMKAVDITLIDDPQTIEAYSSKRGELFSGKVKKGTPICVEEERIMLTDSFGNRTGQDTVYTTLNEVYATKEDNKNEKSYILQNTGYFETPQPIGAGVYVLAEIKAPDGYAKSNPVAIEIYSDSSKYYVDGDMYAKADMLKYDFNSVIDFDYIHKDKTKNP